MVYLPLSRKTVVFPEDTTSGATFSYLQGEIGISTLMIPVMDWIVFPPKNSMLTSQPPMP